MDVTGYLQRLKESGNFRSIPGAVLTGVTDYSSNDYMGLAADEELHREFLADAGLVSLPMTSSASRLLAARQKEYCDLELFLSDQYQQYRRDDTATLLFNSGYHANTGLLQAIAGRDTLILADRLVHASIIDGIVLSRAKFLRFPHNDFDRLSEMLDKNAPEFRHVIVVVESVYSMDGDFADIDRLIDLKRLHGNVTLYVDEAHAFGVMGPKGLGLVAASKAPAEVDVTVGTFGKAAASMGAFAVTTSVMRHFLINSARSFIFSTALPPVMAAWTRCAVARLLTMDSRREHLTLLGGKLREVIMKYSRQQPVASHIQPLVVGDPKLAVVLSRRLLDNFRIKALPIRKPTVPAGTERLRFSLSADMQLHDIQLLDEALSQLFPA